LKGRLCRDAPARFKRLASELDVAYREVDELWLALDHSHLSNLKDAKKRGEANGATGYEIIGPERIRELEPHVTENAVAGLYAKGPGVIYTPEWAFALVENAIQNGIHVHLGTAVTAIRKVDSSSYVVSTTKGTLRTKYMVNAAGLHVDEIAWMVGDDYIRLSLRKGTMLIFDKFASQLVNHMIFGTFSERHSQNIAPTAHGNLILGIHYVKPNDKSDTKVSREGIFETMKLGKELIPELSESDIISSFSGILPDNTITSNGDFYVGPSENAQGVFHVIVGAPGLTASPGIADLVIKMLLDAGLETDENKGFQRKRIGWPRFEAASLSEKQDMIGSNSEYGHIVCRCEHITKAEISEAIRRGADTMDAVKHLTRAGMGRCQGGFCGISVLKHLARQLHISPIEVTKKGKGSYQIKKLTKGVGNFR
jgi:glycerol-3-phosphate dehydrogenase